MCVVGGITAIRIVLLQIFEELMSVVGGITKELFQEFPDIWHEKKELFV